MEIILPGTGTAIPSKHHNPAGLFVVSAGHSCLVDIGPGTISRLADSGFSWHDIHSLLITHLHSDHTLDLATLLQIFDSAPGDQRKEDFQITGCRGTKGFVRRMFRLYPSIKPHTYRLHIREVLREKFLLPGLSVRCAPTGHTPSSVAYRMEDGSKSLVYSGDAIPGEELPALAKDADVLVCECAYPAGWNNTGHMNADDVGRLANTAGVKTLVITHRYPPALSVDLEKQIGQHFTGRIILADDGLRLTV